MAMMWGQAKLRILKRLSLAVAVFAVGIGAVVLVDLTSTSAPDVGVPGVGVSPLAVFASTEAIVVATNVSGSGDVVTYEGASQAPGWEFDVDRVLYVADRSREHDWGYEGPLSPIPVPSGRLLAAFPGAEVEPPLPSEAVVFLAINDEAIFPVEDTPWIILGAVADGGGSGVPVALRRRSEAEHGQAELFFTGRNVDTDSWEAFLDKIGDPEVIGAVAERSRSRDFPHAAIPAAFQQLGTTRRDGSAELELMVEWVRVNREHGVTRNAYFVAWTYPWTGGDR